MRINEVGISTVEKKRRQMLAHLMINDMAVRKIDDK